MKKSIVKEYFEKRADYWIANSYQSDGYNYPTALHRVRIVREALSAVKGSLRIADLGCGGGHMAMALAEDGHDVTGVDQSNRMVEIAQAQASELPADIAARIRFVSGEVDTDSLPSHSFDAVTCMGVIGYQPTDDIIFATAARLLKPKGMLLVSCRNRLFNMNSPSFRTVHEVESGGALDLLAELMECYKPLPAEAGQAVIDRINSLPEKMLENAAVDFVATKATSANPDDLPGIESRQHTPHELEVNASAHGFRPLARYGVHPHLIDPNVKRLLPPGVFNALSEVLEVLENQPVAMALSSVFISVFTKE